MLRGTIYYVVDTPEGERIINRLVETMAVDGQAAFRFDAMVHAPKGVRLEFGPIAPPWRKLDFPPTSREDR